MPMTHPKSPTSVFPIEHFLDTSSHISLQSAPPDIWFSTLRASESKCTRIDAAQTVAAFPMFSLQFLRGKPASVGSSAEQEDGVYWRSAINRIGNTNVHDQGGMQGMLQQYFLLHGMREQPVCRPSNSIHLGVYCAYHSAL